MPNRTRTPPDSSAARARSRSHSHTSGGRVSANARVASRIAKQRSIAGQSPSVSVRAAMRACGNVSARSTIARDVEVNRMDTEMDERCIRLLALHQPAASDLRFITTGLKITTDLERIGDNAVNICERAVELNQEPQLKPYIDIPRMAQIAQSMVKDSLDAFMRDDTTLAEEVIDRDDEVDQLNYQIYRELLSYMVEDPETIAPATKVLFVSKYIERIADHATNIAEMVVFMVEGRNIKHMEKEHARD